MKKQNITSDQNKYNPGFIPLRDSFTKNCLPYTLIKRNKFVCLYGIGGEYTKEIIHFEVSKITLQPEYVRFDKTYPASEQLPSNEDFGKIDKSRCLTAKNKAIALEYYDWLTEYYSLSPLERSTLPLIKYKFLQ